jgi:hypothetical protein
MPVSRLPVGGDPGQAPACLRTLQATVRNHRFRSRSGLAQHKRSLSMLFPS